MYDSCRWGLAAPPHPIRLVVWLKDVILSLSLSHAETGGDLSTNRDNSYRYVRLPLFKMQGAQLICPCVVCLHCLIYSNNCCNIRVAETAICTVFKLRKVLTELIACGPNHPMKKRMKASLRLMFPKQQNNLFGPTSPLHLCMLCMSDCLGWHTCSRHVHYNVQLTRSQYK